MTSRIFLWFSIGSTCLALGCSDDRMADSRSFNTDGSQPGNNISEESGDSEANTNPSAITLYVQAGRFEGQAQTKPWSSWWYPLWDDFLFRERNGELAPLQKYDQFSQKFLRKTTSAAAYERDEIHEPRAVAWAGLCDAWALASVLEREPSKEARHGDLRFSVADLKALLLKTYERVEDLKVIGTRFEGHWDDVYEDIYPHQFHSVLQTELIEKKRPFIMDDDAGVEVWNAPVFRTIVQIDRDPSADNIVHVRTWLVAASPHVEDPNFTGTLETAKEYTYDLEGSWQDDRFAVKKSRWTDRSRWDHPDFVIVVPPSVKRGSFNPQIEVSTVDSIMRPR